jgi:hypothetical protein
MFEDDLALAVMVVAEERAKHLSASEELAEVGIRSATDADLLAWLAATPRQRRSLRLAWAVMVASPEPAWKKPNGRTSK